MNAYFLYNSVISLLGGLVALAVSYYAHRYGRVAGSGFLRLLSIGFMMLGVGLIAQASAFIFFDLNAGRISDRGALVYGGTIIYLTLQAAAYLLIAVSYARRVSGGTPLIAGASALVALQVTAPAPPLLFGTNVYVFGELVLIVLVALIVIQGLFVYEDNRNRLSLSVLLAFTCILLANIAKLSASLFSSGFLYLVGDLVQLGGFGILLLFLLRRGPVGRD